jgi:hypothetical protein
MFPRLSILLVLLASCSVQGAFGRDKTQPSAEDVSFCQLANTPMNFSGKRVRVRAIYSYFFEISSLRTPACCPENSAEIWVDFDDSRGKNLLHKLPKGMGTVLGVWVGTIETGRVFGPNGEQVRLIVDKIEKIEQKERAKSSKRPDWVPKGCVFRKRD